VRAAAAASHNEVVVAQSNLHDDTLLTREQLADALTDRGFPTTAPTLATKASRGGGPPYAPWGRRVLYRWGDAIAWAQARLGPVRRTTTEHDVFRIADALNRPPGFSANTPTLTMVNGATPRASHSVTTGSRRRP
jgi:hypothetical protein